MSKEDQFWDWFKLNESKYYFLNQMTNFFEREKLLDDLLDQLHLYCNSLYFEIGGIPDEKQDLIITADGNMAFFDKVESLVKHSPKLEYWNVIAFKPPIKESVVQYKDIFLNPEKIFFIPLAHSASLKIGLRLYIENYNSERKEDFLFVAYLILDNLLGEKSCALNIEYIEIESLNKIIEKAELINLTDLPRYIKWKKNRLPH